MSGVFRSAEPIACFCSIRPRLTFRGTDVLEILEGVCKEVGFPATIRVDQGSEFVPRESSASKAPRAG
jgi:hypothetical protein